MASCSILVAEDELHLRDLVKSFLEGAGHRVVVTANGAEALAALEQDSFDLVLTDLVMGKSDGLSLIAKLTKKYPRLKIVAMSGGGFVPAEQYLQIAKTAGAHVVLSKPFTRDTLLQAINQAKR